MLMMSLMVSAVFLLIVNAIAMPRRGSGAGAAALCSLGAACYFFCLTEALTLNALLVAVAGAVCWAVKAPRRWFVLSSLGATVAAYAIIAVVGVWEWRHLQKDNQPESLAPRLAYEERPRTAAPLERMAPMTADRLASLEAHLERANRGYPVVFRRRSLELVHAGVVEQFINSSGFGVMRIRQQPMPFYARPDWPGEEPTEQAGPLYPPPELSSSSVQVASGEDLLEDHENNMLDFLHPSRFGIVRDREHVIGFRPHRLSDVPWHQGRWRITRLELVSLLKYEEPVVYLSANFPRMDELTDAPTRPLDAFEREALTSLRQGEDLMVQESPRHMRMLGSLRAAEQCLQCHQVQRGELLGAFSYQMSPQEMSSK